MQEIPRAILLPPPSHLSSRASVRAVQSESESAVEAARARRQAQGPGQAFLTLIEQRREDTVEIKGKQFRFRPYSSRGATDGAAREAELNGETADTGAISHTLNEHMITELAIKGRDAAELMKIMPGMGNATGLNQSMFSSLTTQSNTGPIGTMSAQGAQLYGGLTMMADGASLLDPGNMGTQTANINQNQIQEVSLLTSAYGAEYAKGPIVFQALGKSG